MQYVSHLDTLHKLRLIVEPVFLCSFNRAETWKQLIADGRPAPAVLGDPAAQRRLKIASKIFESWMLQGAGDAGLADRYIIPTPCYNFVYTFHLANTAILCSQLANKS